jgi:hypothetical protein
LQRQFLLGIFGIAAMAAADAEVALGMGRLAGSSALPASTYLNAIVRTARF